MDVLESYGEVKRRQEREALERTFTAFERKVLMAWLDRYCHDLPTYHPAKALKILRRWPAVIDRARQFLFDVRKV